MKEDDISRACGTHGEKRIACRVLMINHGKKETTLKTKVSMVTVY